jgi:hypothetical protein
MATRTRPMNWLERQVKAQAALAGIEQVDVAVLLGMSPQAFYQRLKRADSGRVDADFLSRLGEALNCDTSVFTRSMEADKRRVAAESNQD